MGFYEKKKEGSEYNRVFLSPPKAKPPSIFSFLRSTFFFVLYIIQLFLIRFTLLLFIHPIFSCIVAGFMGLIWWGLFLWLIFWKLPELDDKYFDSELWDEPKNLLVTIPGFIVFYSVFIFFVYIIDESTL
jgi:hypothetical protein